MHIVNFFVYFLITFLPVIVSSWAILFFVDAFLYECVFVCFLARVLFCVDAFLYECVFSCVFSCTSACLRVFVRVFLNESFFACFRACLRGRLRVFFLACFRFFFYKFPALLLLAYSCK